RRHTRCYRDWSSDVCSSDLAAAVRAADEGSERAAATALPSRACPGRLRAGASRAAWRGRAAFGFFDRAATSEVAAGVRAVEEPAAGRARRDLRMGRWAVREGGARGQQSRAARDHRGLARWT